MKIFGTPFWKNLRRQFKFWVRYRLLDYSTIVLFILLTVIVGSALTIADLFDSEFNWHDILVEAHGLFFDLVVFGLILAVFDFARTRKREISQLTDDIQNLLSWKSEESKNRILANINRLYDLNVRQFHLASAHLPFADLEELDITGSVMSFINFKEGSFLRSNLSNVMLSASNLEEVNFAQANLSGAELSSTNCKKATFIDTNLCGTNFLYADLRKASFIGCQFSKETNLKNTKLQGLIVHSPDWLKEIQSVGVKGSKKISKKFDIKPAPENDSFGIEVFKLEKKPVGL